MSGCSSKRFSFFPQDTASAKGPRNQVLGILIFDIRPEGKCFLETTHFGLPHIQLSRLRGLKSITVLFRDDDDDDDNEDNNSVQDIDEENNGREIANDEDNRELNNRHDYSKELDTEVIKLPRQVGRL